MQYVCSSLYWLTAKWNSSLYLAGFFSFYCNGSAITKHQSIGIPVFIGWYFDDIIFYSGPFIKSATGIELKSELSFQEAYKKLSVLLNFDL